MKAHLTCPVCGHKWSIGYFKWLFTAIFHWFSFKKKKDYRYTKCPNCGKASWVASHK